MDYSNKKTLTDLTVDSMKVLVNADLNVPMADGEISDDSKIKNAIPTIDYLRQHNAKIIVISKLGEVKSLDDEKTYSLEPVAEHLGTLLNTEVQFVNATRGTELETAINNLQPGQVLVMQNANFEDINDKGEITKFESKNDPELGKYWAGLADIFVDDDFSDADEPDASDCGIAANAKDSAIGMFVQKELTMLGKAIDNPTKPFVLILGGASVVDKIGIINNLVNKADKILIGGGMAYTFLAAKGINTGKSLLEADGLAAAVECMAKAKGKIVLPVDSANAPAYEDVAPTIASLDEGIPADMMGMDIGPKTIELFSSIIHDAKTVVWNGPLGVTEFKNFQNGTISIANAIGANPDCYSLVGGLDSSKIAKQLGLADKFSWVSASGETSLSYMEGTELPAIALIKNK